MHHLSYPLPTAALVLCLAGQSQYCPCFQEINPQHPYQVRLMSGSHLPLTDCDGVVPLLQDLGLFITSLGAWDNANVYPGGNARAMQNAEARILLNKCLKMGSFEWGPCLSSKWQLNAVAWRRHLEYLLSSPRS